MVSVAIAQPSLVVKPDTLKFGYVSVNGWHDRTLVFKNAGNQTLVIDSVISSGAIGFPPVNGESIAAAIHWSSIRFSPFSRKRLF
jgi:hypothetical protein